MTGRVERHLIIMYDGIYMIGIYFETIVPKLWLWQVHYVNMERTILKCCYHRTKVYRHSSVWSTTRIYTRFISNRRVFAITCFIDRAARSTHPSHVKIPLVSHLTDNSFKTSPPSWKLMWLPTLTTKSRNDKKKYNDVDVAQKHVQILPIFELWFKCPGKALLSFRCKPSHDNQFFLSISRDVHFSSLPMFTQFISLYSYWYSVKKKHASSLRLIFIQKDMSD